jgi:hypothetical protein
MAKNLVDKTIDYVLEKLGQLCLKILKLAWKIFKKGCSNVIIIKTILKTKEKYILLLSIIISVIFIWMQKLHPGYYIFSISYFWIKGCCQIVKKFYVEQKFLKKYKNFYDKFDNKIKVVAATHSTLTIHSQSIGLSSFQKRKEEMELYFNRRIDNIYNRNVRTIVIEFRNGSNKLKGKYKLIDVIKTIDTSKYKIPFLLGVNRTGKHIIADLKKTKHIQISGETGGGKTTLEHVIIQSMMYLNNNISFILTDFKILGFCVYKKFSNCLFVRNQTQFLDILRQLNKEMMSRIEKMEKLEMEEIEQYNEISSEKLPYIVLLVDEIADLKNADNKEEVTESEQLLRRIINMARATGIYVIAATQKPSKDQFDTNTKAQLTTKISFKVLDRFTQDQTGIKGTENLGEGQFKLLYEGEEMIIKGYWVDRLKSWEVFNKLLLVKGGNEIDKSIIKIQEKY